jgi:hypothetical protein
MHIDANNFIQYAALATDLYKQPSPVRLSPIQPLAGRLRTLIPSSDAAGLFSAKISWHAKTFTKTCPLFDLRDAANTVIKF